MENRDIRIAFFDIDGTLLPPDHHLPESTVAALNILRAKGVQLYLATGRPPYHLHYLKKDLPFEFDVKYWSFTFRGFMRVLSGLLPEK